MCAFILPFGGCKTRGGEAYTRVRRPTRKARCVMSKITCPDCHRRISHVCSGCPVCGFYVEGWWNAVGEREHARRRVALVRRGAYVCSVVLLVMVAAVALPVGAHSDQVPDHLVHANTCLE